MQTDARVRSEVALGVVPNGMMERLRTFLGIQGGQCRTDHCMAQEAACEENRPRMYQIYQQAQRGVSPLFLNCINIGFIGDNESAPADTLIFFGSRTLSFLFSFILLVFQRLEYRMHLKINTDEIKRNVMTVCIGNSLGYGQTPNAVPYNGNSMSRWCITRR